MALSSLALAGDRAPVPLFRYLTPAAGAVAKLEPGCCRWPLGGPAEPDFRFCHGPRLARSSYCARHERVARAGGQQGTASAEPRS